MPEALVIGGGFGGLAAALRLRAKGCHVKVVERCAELGGRAQTFSRGGYRHDAGPTVITAPFLFDELFQLFGRQFSRAVTLKELNPWYRYYFRDGETFSYGGTLQDTLSEIDRISPQDVAGYEGLLAESQKIFDVGFSELADQPFDRMGTMLRQIPRLLRLRCYRSVWRLVSEHIRDDRLRQAFAVQPLLVGGNPFDTTCIYNLIHFLERKWGIHFAMGGTGAIVTALTQLMGDTGIQIQTSTTVKQIITRNGRAVGVEYANGEREECDLVVANTDAAHLYRHLIPQQDQKLSARIKLRQAKYSMGLFVLYFGSRKQYPEVPHHSIWLGKRYRKLLKEIFAEKALPHDFSLYVHRPTATDPSFAPPNRDSYYVLAPVPNLNAAIDWDEEGPRMTERILGALDATIMPGLLSNVEHDFYMTPHDFSANYLSERGAGFSIAPLFYQSAWFRFHNRAEGLKNVYLVGAGTHPGGGVPGVLCSAKATEHLIAADLGWETCHAQAS
tara:strand:- start:262 stop:1764 length:1503 start_codon:yes stop_codon:yes gene_type:complete